MTGTNLRSPRVPAQRVYRGAGASLSPCHPERSEGSGLTPSEVARRALARVLDPPERLGEVFRLRRVTFLDARKVTKRTFPGVCAHQSPTVIDGSPALLGQGGRFRQAIPGLSKTASASMPRPRLRAAIPPRPAMLGAARRGGTSEAESKANQKHLVIPAKAGIQGFGVCISSLRIPARARMTTVKVP